MKKLLLVLFVVALASFLFVGCLPGVTPGEDEGEDEVEGEVEQAVTIEIEDQYPADVKEFIRADVLKVTVTFAEAIPEDKSVTFQAKEAWVSAPAVGDVVVLFPDTTRKVWSTDDPATETVEVGYDFGDANVYNSSPALSSLGDCEEICLYVTIADCCEPSLNEVYTEVVKLDNTPPLVDLNITFKDCEVDECDPVPGAYFTFAPNTYGTCPEVPCCVEECSGIAKWSIVDPAMCNPCPPVEGTGCPEGTFDCGCLLYPKTDTKDYTLVFTFADNVGNKIVDTWKITVDTDNVTGFANNQGDNENNPVANVEELPKVNIPYTTCVDGT
ncbi:MAG TPA: hypothetical protein DEG96_02605 [Candidatus Atribacteria bacterium]|nr:hypothetical protein [Candidatus Atribacteria bacterium]